MPMLANMALAHAEVCPCEQDHIVKFRAVLWKIPMLLGQDGEIGFELCNTGIFFRIKTGGK